MYIKVLNVPTTKEKEQKAKVTRYMDLAPKGYVSFDQVLKSIDVLESIRKYGGKR